MDIRKTIRELYEEKKRLDEVIASLEELQKAKAVESPAKRRGRKSMDVTGRQEVSRRMKKYWADRRKQK